MSNAIVYILNENNEIIDKFECDFNDAIMRYHNKREIRGRYYVGLKDKPVPFKEAQKKLFDVKHVTDRALDSSEEPTDSENI